MFTYPVVWLPWPASIRSVSVASSFASRSRRRDYRNPVRHGWPPFCICVAVPGASRMCRRDRPEPFLGILNVSKKIKNYVNERFSKRRRSTHLQVTGRTTFVLWWTNPEVEFSSGILISGQRSCWMKRNWFHSLPIYATPKTKNVCVQCNASFAS